MAEQSEAANIHRLISEKGYDNNELIYCVFTPSCLVQRSNTPLYVKLVIDPKATIMCTADLQCRHCVGHPDDSARRISARENLLTNPKQNSLPLT